MTSPTEAKRAVALSDEALLAECDEQSSLLRARRTASQQDRDRRSPHAPPVQADRHGHRASQPAAEPSRGVGAASRSAPQGFLRGAAAPQDQAYEGIAAAAARRQEEALREEAGAVGGMVIPPKEELKAELLRALSADLETLERAMQSRARARRTRRRSPRTTRTRAPSSSRTWRASGAAQSTS